MSLFSPQAKGVYRFQNFDANVSAVFSGKEFRNESSSDFLKETGLARHKLVTLKQVHSANIVHVRSDYSAVPPPSADGMITKEVDIALGIKTADCVPVFFYDQAKSMIGICHAGWKGVYYGIAEKMIQAMEQNFESKASQIQVGIGPYIHRCCYEVGIEFSEMFPDSFTKSSVVGKGSVDLGFEIKNRLQKQGVLLENIEDVKLCTSCQNNQFFSYRADQLTDQRMLSVIAFKTSKVKQ